MGVIRADDGAKQRQDAIRLVTSTAPDPTPEEAVPKPTIRVETGRLHEITTRAEGAIVAAGLPIFQRGHQLVTPAVQEIDAADGRKTRTATLCPVTVHALRDRMAESATWVKDEPRSGGDAPADPPREVAEVLLSRMGRWAFPPIAGVITTPTLRPDGTVVAAPGYDQLTGLYHAADASLALDPSVHMPDRGDAERALALLDGLLAGFPFVDLVDRAVALSMLIVPVIRGAISVAPLHAVTAPTPGSGKSYLADVASTIATGRPCPVISAGARSEETEKRVVGLLLAGIPLISLDNINGELEGDQLCQAVERPIMTLRPLGQSQMQEVQNRVTILATGNNLRPKGDMVRRTLVCDLDARLERPELRQFDDRPTAVILEDRGRYVSAALTIVRAYGLAGRPGMLPRIASYEGWSDQVRSALVWLGCADPAASTEETRASDPELADLRAVMGAWAAVFGDDGATVRAAVERAAMLDAVPSRELADALGRVAGVRGKIESARLGRWLAGRAGRPLDGRRFERVGITDGAVRWQLVDRPEGG